MSHWPSTVSCPSNAGVAGQVAPTCESQRLPVRPHHSPIDVLDDDSLLNIFYLCQPIYSEKADQMTTDDTLFAGGTWAHERWWYKLVHVCQKWRYLVFRSPSYLRLSLSCTPGTPVADMLAHSPPLPLIINHLRTDEGIPAQDEEGITLALQHSSRVRRIRLQIPGPVLQRLTLTMKEEFPILEYLYITPRPGHFTFFKLPNTFRAPNIRHLMLKGSFFIMDSLLATPKDLVTLSFEFICPLAYLNLNGFLECLSLLPHLETLRILSQLPFTDQEAERMLLRPPTTTHVTLLNLQWLGFKGTSAYLEALLPHITTPILRLVDVTFNIAFFSQPTFPIPRLLQFIYIAESHRFSSARVMFDEWGFSVMMYPFNETGLYVMITLFCGQTDRQVESAVQFFNALKTLLSVVESLTLEHEHGTSLERDDEAGRTHWRDFLRLFNNVKTLYVSDGLIQELARSLQIRDGESLVELLPELRELSFTASTYTGESLRSIRSFIVARRDAGYPVILAHR